jgi:hypothetical protein
MLAGSGLMRPSSQSSNMEVTSEYAKVRQGTLRVSAR